MRYNTSILLSAIVFCIVIVLFLAKSALTQASTILDIVDLPSQNNIPNAFTLPPPPAPPLEFIASELSNMESLPTIPEPPETADTYVVPDTESLQIPATPLPNPVSDIAGHWAEQYILQLFNMGAVNGKGDSGLFDPNADLTRAELAKIIALVFGFESTQDNTVDVFPDVPSDTWFGQYINILQSKSIVNGFPDGTFAPHNAVTRGEAVKIVLSAAGLAADVDKQEIIYDFSDVPADSWYAPYITSAAQKRIITGFEGNIFKPDAPITRAEISKVIVKAFEKYLNNSLPQIPDLPPAQRPLEVVPSIDLVVPQIPDLPSTKDIETTLFVDPILGIQFPIPQGYEVRRVVSPSADELSPLECREGGDEYTHVICSRITYSLCTADDCFWFGGIDGNKYDPLDGEGDLVFDSQSAFGNECLDDGWCVGEYKNIAGVRVLEKIVTPFGMERGDVNFTDEGRVYILPPPIKEAGRLIFSDMYDSENSYKKYGPIVRTIVNSVWYAE